MGTTTTTTTTTRIDNGELTLRYSGHLQHEHSDTGLTSIPLNNRATVDIQLP